MMNCTSFFFKSHFRTKSNLVYLFIKLVIIRYSDMLLQKKVEFRSGFESASEDKY